VANTTALARADRLISLKFTQDYDVRENDKGYTAAHIVAVTGKLQVLGSVQTSSDKTAGKMPRVTSGRIPGNCQAVAKAPPPDVRTATRKTTYNMTCNGQAVSASQPTQRTMQYLVKHLPRQLAKSCRLVFNHDSSKL
jgi:hypothetical protein